MSFSLIDAFTKRLSNPDFIDGDKECYVLLETGFKAYAVKGSGIPYLIRLESEIEGEKVVTLSTFTTVLCLISDDEKYLTLLDIYRSIGSGNIKTSDMTAELVTWISGTEALGLLLPRSNWFVEKGLSFNDDGKIVGKDGMEIDDPVVKQFQEALDHLQSLTPV